MDPLDLVAGLAAPGRLRAFSALVLGARSVEEVAERSGMSRRAAIQALAQLAEAGLATRDKGTWAAVPEVFGKVVREARPDGPGEAYGGADWTQEKILRTFLRAGRLVSWPAQRSRRRVLLEHFAFAFEPGRRYSEKEVNVILRAFADDYVTLRRYLVDEEFLGRRHGEYWRIGGRVDLG